MQGITVYNAQGRVVSIANLKDVLTVAAVLVAADRIGYRIEAAADYKLMVKYMRTGRQPAAPDKERAEFLYEVHKLMEGQGNGNTNDDQ